MSLRDFIEQLSEIEPVIVDAIGGQAGLLDDIDNIVAGATSAASLISGDFDGLTPVNWSSNQNDVPKPVGTGFAVTLTGNRNVSGISGGNHGDVILIFNASPNNRITFRDDDDDSLQGNRLFCPNGSDLRCNAMSSVYLRKDSSLDDGNGGWHFIINRW